MSVSQLQEISNQLKKFPLSFAQVIWARQNTQVVPGSFRFLRDVEMDATLVLDSSGSALHIVPWERAIVLVILRRAYSLEESEDPILVPDKATRGHTARAFELKRPIVIQLYRFVGFVAGSPALSRRNLRARDEDTCQYCGKKLLSSEITMDHILPRSRGGKLTWENIVLACSRCNLKKGNRTPDEARMSLLRTPYRPKAPILLEHFAKRLQERRCG